MVKPAHIPGAELAPDSGIDLTVKFTPDLGGTKVVQLDHHD